eukprot:CAMPEP_0194037412 /NCGR_PEP_ID=MMETSP0009_2-20130614/9756_1 /TAXON_ID=210454 /ORGANISM="Grammatophora oceanica, Strain CCMP 410" /LENGTH=227 /DNA_ID=CAMNT_0038679557 /DNA_START=101 /DNA_END=784 /DNA_ORIENTATION=+
MSVGSFDVVTASLSLFTTAFVVAVAYFICRIYQPQVVTYPWEVASTKEDEKTVVLAGSYNPPHNGHLAMLQYLATKYDKVIAVIGFNRNKTYLVTPQEREALLCDMLQQMDGCKTVEVKVVEGYIWRYAHRVGASILFRGIRSWIKDGSEERVLHTQNIWGPILLGRIWPIPTVYLEGKPEYNHISSTLIRNICHGAQEDPPTVLNELVPKVVAERVAQLYTRGAPP